MNLKGPVDISIFISCRQNFPCRILNPGDSHTGNLLAQLGNPLLEVRRQHAVLQVQGLCNDVHVGLDDQGDPIKLPGKRRTRAHDALLETPLGPAVEEGRNLAADADQQ